MFKAKAQTGRGVKKSKGNKPKRQRGWSDIGLTREHFKYWFSESYKKSGKWGNKESPMAKNKDN